MDATFRNDNIKRNVVLPRPCRGDGVQVETDTDGERAGHRPDAMSGGEQQRVAIARSLLMSPPVLLADEPTGNLDSASSENLWGLLESVARDYKVTIVMVTHEPAAAAHCSSVMVLRDGRLHGTFNTEGRDAAGIAARYQQCLRQE